MEDCISRRKLLAITGGTAVGASAAVGYRSEPRDYSNELPEVESCGATADQDYESTTVNGDCLEPESQSLGDHLASEGY